GRKFIWNFARLDQIEVYGAKAPKSGKKTIIFNGPTGPKSFADGDGTYDGICEVCHTETTYHQNNAAGDHTHNAGSNCITCHTHASGFKGGADHSTFINGDTGANGDCIDCHAAVVSDPSLHPSCETCHTASPPAINTTPFVGGDTGNSYTALTDDGNYSWNGSNRIQDASGYTIGDVGLFVPILCSECHDTKPAGLADGTHGGHPVTDWDFTAITNDCVDCHGDGGNGTVAGIHNRGDAATYPSGDCTICHDLSGGDYTVRTVGDAANGIDGDATLASGRAGDCLTCHPGATYSKISIHHDTADATATPTNACTSCHNTANGHAGNHDALVAMQDPNCQVCHAATPASGGDNVPVDGTPGNTVHDYCTSCHVNPSGDLIDTVSIPTPNGWVTTMDNGDGTTSTSNGGGTCTECHTAYFDGHEHGTTGPPEHTMSTVALCLNCHTATTIPYLSAGEVHESLACYTCHSATDGLLIGSANGAGAGANCQTCHIGYFDNHGHSHTFTATADCATCHNLDNTDGSNARNAIAAPFAGTGEVHAVSGCYTCHDPGTGALRSLAIGNAAATGCIDCHTDTWTTIHTGAPGVTHVARVEADATCTLCHGNPTPSTSNARDAATSPFVAGGEVHAANACATCHTGSNDGSLNSGPFINADQNTAGSCSNCHTVTSSWGTIHNGAPGVDHTTRVDGLAECVGCHDATAGGPNGLMPVSPINHKVHDRCSACHVQGGALSTGNTIYGNQPIARGNCGTCHTAAYFDSHVHGTTGGYVEHDVTYNALFDLSQVSTPGDNPCGDCHSGNNADGNGIALDSWADILSEHVTGCSRCHSYTDDGTGTPPQATNDTTIASGAGVICTTCHTPKLDPDPASDHGYLSHDAGPDRTVVTWTGADGTGTDPDCLVCHDDGGAEVVYSSTTHGGDCTKCHAGIPNPLQGTTTLATAMPDGGAGTDNGGGSCVVCHDTSYTVHTVNNANQAAALHDMVDTTYAATYNCDNCHGTLTTWLEIVALHSNDCTMCHDSDLTVVKNAINAGRSNVNGFMGSASVVNCDTCHVTDHDFAAGDATWDLATLDTAAIKDAYGRGHGTSPDTVHGEHNNLANSTGSQAQAGVPAYTGKLSGAYGGLLAADYNCNDCHDIDNAADAAVVKQQKRIQEHNLGNCLLCHGYANVGPEIAAGAGSAPFDEGAGGTVTNCETCHAPANNPAVAANDTYMYQYDGIRHHTTTHAQAGDCTWCHGDPRPAAITDGFAATAGFVDGDGDGNTLNDGWLDDYNTATPTPIPKQAACRLCHTNYGTVGDGTPWSVDVSGGNGNHGYNITGYSGTDTERTTGLTVYANNFNAGLSGAANNSTPTVNATRITQNTIHRIDANNGSSMINVYDYGACLGCHSVQIMHAAPVPVADYPAATADIQSVPWDTLRYAPGRAVFNLLRGSNDNNQAWNNHRLRYQNGYRTIAGGSPSRGKDYFKNVGPSATAWYFNSEITHSTVSVPLHASFSNFDGQTGSLAVYFADIAAPVIPDNVEFISASWDGATVTVKAWNDDGCNALSVRTRPDGVERIAAGGLSGVPCTGTFALGSITGVTLDIETTNAAGTNNTGNAITDNSNKVPVAVDDAYSTGLNGTISENVGANDTPGEAPNTWEVVTGVPAGQGTLTFSSNGFFTYDAGAFVGTTSFTYTITDTDLEVSNTATVSITVMDLTPAAADDAVSTPPATVLNGDVTANDTQGDTPNTWAVVSGVPAGEGSLTFNGDGSFAYDPGAFTGTTSFTYRITDGNSDVSNTATVTISIGADQIVAAQANWTPGTVGGCTVNPAGTYIEAENFTGGPGAGTYAWEVRSDDAAASGGSYMYTTAGGTNATVTGGQTDYGNLEFPADATYYFWIFAKNPLAGNSTFIGLDGTQVGALTQTSTGAYVWANALQAGTGSNSTLITAGTHSLTMWPREADQRTDGIFISTNASALTDGSTTPAPGTFTVLDPTNCPPPSTATLNVLAANTEGNNFGNVVHAQYEGNTYDLTFLGGNKWSFSGTDLADTYTDGAMWVYSDFDPVGLNITATNNTGNPAWDTVTVTSAEWDGTDTVITATNTWNDSAQLYADYNGSGPTAMTWTGTNWTITFSSVPYAATVDVTTDLAGTNDTGVAVTDTTGPPTPTIIGTPAIAAAGGLGGSDPIVISGFTVPAGTNRVLIIYVGDEDTTGTTVNAATSTFNGQNPTTIRQQTNGRNTQWFGYIPLGTGGAITDDITIDMSAAGADDYAWAAVYEGAAQTQSLWWEATSTNNNLTVDINTPADARVIYASSWNGADTGTFLTSPNTDSWTTLVEDDVAGGWHLGIEERNEYNADASLTVNPANTGTASSRSSLLVISVEKF
ncbi:MAG: Ig-like domain-containing protein, partial [Desulfobulbaceae bacterium]|nr:Ig-like domain-containing protein [Desulfobulbaceae bacterium]